MIISNKMKAFIDEYKKQLADVQYILQYLKTYPTILSDLKIEDIIESDNLYQQFEDWIRLNSKFRCIEKEFFKPYWLPIQRVGLDYFIDISNSNYPIIEAFFNYFEEPYYWEKKILFHSINDLMLADDNKQNLKQYKVDSIIEKYKEYL